MEENLLKFQKGKIKGGGRATFRGVTRGGWTWGWRGEF